MRPVWISHRRLLLQFVLLLNEVTTDLVDIAVTVFVDAQIALRSDGDRGVLREAREALASGGTPADVWGLLYALDTTGRRLPAPKATASHHLNRMVAVLNGGRPPILGTSVHQAKGLQWPHVDVIDPARALINYQLTQTSAEDRLLYVALTRGGDRPAPVDAKRLQMELPDPRNGHLTTGARPIDRLPLSELQPSPTLLRSTAGSPVPPDRAAHRECR